MKEGGRFSHKSLSFEEYLKLFDPFLESLFKFHSQNCKEVIMNLSFLIE